MFVKKFIFKYRLYLIIASVIIIIGLFLMINTKKDNIPLVVDALELSNQKDEEKELATYNVDIKGAVKKPGVYKIVSGSIINDVIDIAGGLKSNAYTDNINLSKKVSDEMVIYVYTKNEYKNLNKDVNSNSNNNVNNTKECNTDVKSADISPCFKESSSVIVSEKEVSNTNESDNQSNNLINLNTATKEELMSLSGVGETKADCIIEYRNQNGGFKTIEEIKNISGIGDASFAKIKDFITV